MAKEVWTPLKLINWTTEYFTRNGVEEARLDAELLLAHALGVERIMLYAGFDRVVAGEELAGFRAMVKERAAGRPAKYIIGRAEFYSLSFAVDERVLIPRPETELLVERALAVMKDNASGEFQLAVEIGTGSGAVVVALAANFSDAGFIATDLSSKALEVARANAEANKAASRIELLTGDLFDPLRTLALESKVDLVVCNPPYVSQSGWAGLPREIREHEPRQALVAGPAGTEVQERLVCEAPQYLRPGGTLLLEIDNGQREDLVRIASRSGAYEDPTFHKDYGGLWRVCQLRKD